MHTNNIRWLTGGAGGADAAGQRLQHDAAQLAATVSCSGLDLAAVARGQTATRAATVLSDLLAWADARAGAGEGYDQARIVMPDHLLYLQTREAFRG